jgi:hypothetical protein
MHSCAVSGSLCALLLVPFALAPCVAAQAPGVQVPAAKAANDAPPAHDTTARDKPTREQLLTLFSVMRIRAQTEEMLKMVPAALQQQLQSEEQEVEISLSPGGGELTDDQKAARDEVTTKYFQMTASIYPMDEMLNDMVEVYQRHLTREDVDAITAFYRSTPGQHILDAQPLMAKEVMPAVMKKLESRNKDLVEHYRKELNDAMGPPKVAPPPAPPKS